MPESETRALGVRLPLALIRAVKFDALRREIPLVQWWREAGETLLRERARESAEGT